MFKKKKPLAQHDDVKLGGSMQQQAPIDFKKFVEPKKKTKTNGSKTRKN